MEISSLTIFELLSIGLIVIGSAKFVAMLYRQFAYWKERKVPHVWALPVLGSAWKVFFRQFNLMEYSLFVYNSHPNARYVGAMDFFTPTVLLRDTELIREIGIKSFERFPNHRSFVTEEMDPIFGKNVFSLKDERWREMRNTLSPSFTSSKMKFMFELVSKVAQDFVGYLYDHPEICTMIEAKEMLTRYTNDVIATSAFGISVNSLKDPDNEFYTRGIDVSRFTGVLRMSKFLLFRLNPHLTRMAGLKFLSRASANFFSNVISETIKARKGQGIVRPDMIHLLMRATDSSKSSLKMDINDIVAQAFIFFLAGFDTSSTMMCHLVYELAVHQDIQQRLREEVDRYLSEGNGQISYESLSKMEYMDMVISEALRMHPPTVLTDRLCTEKYELPPAESGYNGTTIYPNHNVLIPIYALHHDPKYFPEPETFNPERFSLENKDKINPYAYIPFGLGPRKCIGNRFALMETKILIVHLLEKFMIKSNEKTPIPLVYKKASFTLMAKDGFWFTLEKRNV